MRSGFVREHVEVLEARPGEVSRVTFWHDAAPLVDLETAAHAPAVRGWLVAYVPDGVSADFDTAEIRIDTFVTPFGEGQRRLQRR